MWLSVGRAFAIAARAAGGIAGRSSPSVGAASAIPILFIRDVPVPAATTAQVSRLLARFIPIEVVFGLGAGSFIPFTNLFFADRFGLGFGAIGASLRSRRRQVAPA